MPEELFAKLFYSCTVFWLLSDVYTIISWCCTTLTI